VAKSRVNSTININLGRRYVLRKVVAGVNLAAEDGANQVVDILGMPPTRSGKHYPGNPNPSSAPGEAPAPQSGLYRQGVAATPAELKGSTVRATVASRGAQAAALEFGTEKIEPRPHVRLLQTDPVRRKRLLKVFQIGARRS
jgi:hypothetical protein